MSPFVLKERRLPSAFSREEARRNIFISPHHGPNITVKCEKSAAGQRQTITLQSLDEYVILWVQYFSGQGECPDEVILYIYFKKRGDIWLNHLCAASRQESLLTGNDESYLCAKKSFKCFLVDLFLNQPHNLLLLELIDEIENPLGRNAHMN